jgi:hypothetical protein
MTAARIKRAANFTLQRTMGSRCSPLAAERGVRLHVTTAARIFGVLIAVLGLAYSAVAIYSLVNVEHTGTILEAVKAPEHKEFGFRSIEEWKDGVRINSWLFLSVGIGAVICGLGITARKEWARRIWLVASMLLVAFVLFVSVGSGDMWRRYIELLALALPSFALLTRSFTRTARAI